MMIFQTGDRVIRVTDNKEMPKGTKATIRGVYGNFIGFDDNADLYFYAADNYKLLVTCKVGQFLAINSLTKYWDKIGANK